uniref:Uncharacterized protein n=1 Tax=Romanomermis culicivorax TaxID=13658 RepID=A0A915HZS8_ROMCU
MFDDNTLSMNKNQSLALSEQTVFGKKKCVLADNIQAVYATTFLSTVYLSLNAGSSEPMKVS